MTVVTNINSICSILCVPLVTSIGFKWERLVLYIPRVYLGWPDCLIGWCVLIHFFPEKAICSQQLIHLFCKLVDCLHISTKHILRWIVTNCNLAMNFWWISSIDISSSPTLAVNPRITLAWKTFLRSSKFWKLQLWTHPSHVHGRSKPGHLQDSVVERHVCLRNQHLELISVQAKWTGETFKHKSFF